MRRAPGRPASCPSWAWAEPHLLAHRTSKPPPARLPPTPHNCAGGAALSRPTATPQLTAALSGCQLRGWAWGWVVFGLGGRGRCCRAGAERTDTRLEPTLPTRAPSLSAADNGAANVALCVSKDDLGAYSSSSLPFLHGVEALYSVRWRGGEGRCVGEHALSASSCKESPCLHPRLVLVSPLCSRWTRRCRCSRRSWASASRRSSKWGSR